MKYFLLILLFLSPDPTEISRANRMKTDAEKAFSAGDFQRAATLYSELYDTMEVSEPEIALNLAHSYYALGDSANAQTYYNTVTTESNAKLKSIAYQQLGVMAKSPATLRQSLAYLKSALKADPTNEEARYNYEVVKKLLEEQQKQQQNNQNQEQNKQDQENKENQEQQNQDQQSQDQKEQDGEKSEEEDQQDSEKKEGEQGEEEQNKQDQQDQESKEQQEKQQDLNTKQKLEDMNISEEKAKMILEAMKNNEIQYIQQQKRKATERPPSGKPDW